MASAMCSRKPYVSLLQPLVRAATSTSTKSSTTTRRWMWTSTRSISEPRRLLFNNHSFHTTAKFEDDGAASGRRGSDLGALDVLANAPPPSNSIDVCMSSGFKLNNGSRITDGSGVLLVSGEAFRWRPWESPASPDDSSQHHPRGGNAAFRLLNAKGQYDINPQSLDLLAHLWPRPDLVVLGVGPENRPISPSLRKAIAALGIRVEVLDTRNAAAQFNLLATERGVDDVAAALIPIGWREGIGAGESDAGEITHD
ncbi:hypothetical protein BX600DRAFT_510596 [Xylariales sp. PMI_506]|nr:hypothetical protein BX600DRAFT_510596 [Xylariales sp. PMI_506]